jgi:hypothetical protein
MRKQNNPYQMGREMEYNEEPEIVDVDSIALRNGKPYRMGTVAKIRETEEPGDIADQNDEEQRQAAVEQFSNKIKNAVSAKLMGKKINLKMKGNKSLVGQVVNMIKYETDYLSSLMNGQSADDPAMQKNKALIDSESKKLDRMLGVHDFWPFK